MKAVTKVLTGAAGVAALVGMAAPAAAQYNPGYPGYGTNPVNVIGQVLQSVLNPYGQQQYRMNPQMAINRCTAAVQSRLARSSNAGYGYNPYGGGYGAYGQANAYSSARVLGVSRVEQRSRSTLRVRGVASSGQQQQPYGYGYGQYGGYPQQAAADLTFKCDIDSRGYIRDIDINRRRY